MKLIEALYTGDVLAYLAARGKPIARSTWSSYVCRGHAPPPDDHDDDGRPIWLNVTLDEWLASRPGRGWWRRTK